MANTKNTEKPLEDPTAPVNAPETDPKAVESLQHDAKSGPEADKDLEKAIKANDEKFEKEREKGSKAQKVEVIPSDRDANRAPEVGKTVNTQIEGARTEEFVPSTGSGELSEAQIKERDEAIANSLRLPNHSNRDFKGTY